MNEIQEVFERAKAHDEKAWQELLHHYGNLVFGTAVRVGCQPDDAADVSQQVWLALFSGIDSIRDPQALPRWLTVTTRRIALGSLQSPLAEQVALEENLVDESISVEELLSAEEKATLVRNSLEELPERCATLLRYLFGQDKVEYPKVSEALGIPVGSIGPTRARCLAQLARILKRRKDPRE